ncbi:MAG: pyruvate kinase [Phycisphaerae bacterium]
MIIRTKIVATIGPASGEKPMLRRLAEAGCDVFRINFSHGSNEQRESFLRAIREVEQELGEPLAVMGDLCGPKIRVGPVAGGSVLLGEGQEIVIQREPIEGSAKRISTTLAELVDEAVPGEKILINDGAIALKVDRADPPDELVCTVTRGGMLSSGKGVNLPQTELSLSALTEKDRRDVEWIAGREFDYVALSFVRKADDIHRLRSLLGEGGSEARIIAKIEKPQALKNIEEIMQATDGVMVARGDLGVETYLPAVPVAQKRIARLAQKACKPCIIATQMLETMTHSQMPTRAEVSDVANAVLDQTDAVMLSGETAVGEYPARAVGMMNEIVSHVQAYADETCTHKPVRLEELPLASSVAAGVQGILAEQEVAAVCVFTATGASALALAKARLQRPILAISQHLRTVRRMAMYYGVESRRADPPEHTRDVLDLFEQFAKDRGIASPGDRLVVVSGRPIGQHGAANTIVIHTVG